MAGFGADLDKLRAAAGYVSDAAEMADDAARGVQRNQVDAPPPLPRIPNPFGGLGSANGKTSHVFGDTVGFAAIADTYSHHVAAMREHLRELHESALAGSEALHAVVKLYERADDSGKL